MKNVTLLFCIFIFSILTHGQRDLQKDPRPFVAQAKGNGASEQLRNLSDREAVLIAEAFNLWQRCGGKVWTRWVDANIPFLYVADDLEYAVGFPNDTKGFQLVANNRFLEGMTIQARKRSFEPNLAAAFDVEGVNAVVIGTPTVLNKSPSQWVLTSVHEMFHVWQFSNGSGTKVKGLNLGSSTNASWQLDFPFPYKNAEVMRLIHLQSYLVFLAVTGSDSADMTYNASTAVEAKEVYRQNLLGPGSSEANYNYSKFQEWNEGIAFYTEYKIAELAGSPGYQSLKSFDDIHGSNMYRKLWDEDYKNRVFLVKHAGRAARSRTAFYHLGFGKALLLDRLLPAWKSLYFEPNIWLDDLVSTALQPK